jgi:hypothetical protein
MGIEPMTSSLGSWRSTAELLPLTRTDPSLRFGISPADSRHRLRSASRPLTGSSWRSTAELLPLRRNSLLSNNKISQLPSEQHNSVEFRQHLGKQGDC